MINAFTHGYLILFSFIQQYMIIGKKGHRIKDLIAKAHQSLMDAFRINVLLKINVKLVTKQK